MLKKYFAVIALALLLVGEAGAQSRILLPLTGWRYPGNLGQSVKLWSSTIGDTLTSADVDTIDIGVRGGGDLAPLAVTISISFTDADVSAAASALDSFLVRYETGNRGLYVPFLTPTTYDSVLELGSGSKRSPFTRTFVFSDNGNDAPELNNSNFQSGTAIIPHCDAIRIVLDQHGGATDSVSYKINAFGIYQKQ